MKTMENKLKNRDCFLVIDRSGSMVETDTPTKQTRWNYAAETTAAIARKIQEYDEDGITLVLFNSALEAIDNVVDSRVASIFESREPIGGTVMAPALQYCFDAYLEKKKSGKAQANGALVIVVTDGAPSDPSEVVKTISKFTQKLNDGREEFGISFFQVGKDHNATKFLQRLDDNLTSEGAKYDIVDTKTFEEVEKLGLTEAITGALTD